MHAKTTVARSKSFANDRIWLNGTEENIENPRLANCLKEIRKKAKIDDEEHFHICSENNFPTAAGLASSAAGYACLGKLKFIYSEKATKFCEIFTLLLTDTTKVR